MSVYKIPQNVEADDKFVGPLSFKQFIFAGIAGVCAYLSFLSLVRGFWPALFVFVPIIIVTGFLGFPWGRDQSTEVWLAARIRFFLKPRVRIWNQSGVKDLVTITVPKHIEKFYTNGLNQNEVSSRLSSLADLLDSRGWAVKNVNVNMYSVPLVQGARQNDDRLLSVSALPQEVVDVNASDDILDEANNPTAQNFTAMIKTSEAKHLQGIRDTLQSVRDQPTMPLPANTQSQREMADYLFLQQPVPAPADLTMPAVQQAQPMPPPLATFQVPNIVDPYATAAPAVPVAQEAHLASGISQQDEQALLEKVHKDHAAAQQQYSHTRVVMPLGSEPTIIPQPVTPPVDPAIIKLANNDDLNVATLARQATKAKEQASDGEVVISLR